jgi:hypothetical protein
VPVNLYNLLAIITGVSDALDVSEDGQYMKLESNSRKRILSLSQDIVSLTTKGRAITPKAIACGMTLRHYSGQKSVSSLIAGLGHFVGYHTLLMNGDPFPLPQTRLVDISYVTLKHKLFKQLPNVK